jgi:putative ABC transport system substrate-binding protein
MIPMQRRLFLTLLGGARRRRGRWRRGRSTMPVIGYLDNGLPEASAYRVAAFRKGLSESGYVEGRNVAIEFRWAHHDDARLPELAAIWSAAGWP